MKRLLLCALTAFVSFRDIRAAEFRAGDEVRLTQKGTLFFKGQRFRDGEEGETFAVLAHRVDLGKVFVSGKDTEGKDIALAIDQSVTAAVPANADAMIRKVITALRDTKLSEALQIAEIGLRLYPANATLRQLRQDLTAFEETKRRLDSVKVSSATAQVDAERRRRNAATTDRPNRLTGDNTNQTRATQMRDEADRVERQAAVALASAEAAHARATAALDEIIKPVANLTPRGDSRAGKSAVSFDPELKDKLFAQYWVDPFVVPTLDSQADQPSYADTIAFIQRKLSELGQVVEVGFGRNNKQIIVRERSIYATPCTLVCFNPATLSPQVKTFRRNTTFRNQTLERGLVKVSGTDGQKNILLLFAPDVFSATLTSGPQAFYEFEVSDVGDAEKVAKAFAHLITLFGGKADSF